MLAHIECVAALTLQSVFSRQDNSFINGLESDHYFVVKGHSSIPFEYSIPPFYSIDSCQPSVHAYITLTVNNQILHCMWLYMA